MKINLSEIDRELFQVKEGVIAGEPCFLVTPKTLGTLWTQQTKVFRSSIWNQYGKPVSLSLPKFTNWLERPDVFPIPESLVGTQAVEKIDGSLLCISYYKDQLITRSRGTFDFAQLENGHEINILKAKYPQVFEIPKLNGHLSYIYEFVTPTQKIVLDYPEPDIYLVGIVFHETYELATQKFLDEVAQKLGVKRPEYHNFSSLPEMIDLVKAWSGKEGICLYSDKGQVIHKIKADAYLKLHFFKSSLSLVGLIDLFLMFGRPEYDDFCRRIETDFDYECLNMAKPLISKISNIYGQALRIESEMSDFTKTIENLARKDQAKKILDIYGNRSSFCFTKLDGKPFSDKEYRKLFFRILEESL